MDDGSTNMADPTNMNAPLQMPNQPGQDDVDLNNLAHMIASEML